MIRPVMSLAILVEAALEILEPDEGAGLVRLDPAFIEEKGITKREAEILPLLLHCLSYKEIGERLFISPGTVRTHAPRFRMTDATASLLPC